jgi:myxalamid-type polyketide synthase MxaC
LQGVLNLWPVDEKLGSETTAAQWEAAQQRVGGGLLHAAQALLGSAAISGEARIWLATRGGQSVLSNPDSPGEVCQPIQGLAWGLGRVVCFEHPSLFGAMIDLDPEASPEASAAAIWREIEQAGEQDAVAYRSGERLVPRLVRVQEPAAQPLKLRREGSYLITGGLGGLGLLVAEWMAAQGAGHVVLLSRRQFPDRVLWSNLPSDDPHHRGIEAIIKAEKLGTRITVARGDVADETAMRLVLDRLAAEGSPLRGIVHCAMEMTGRSISYLDLSAFQRMCRAKAVGAWVLNRLTLGLELDFFALFSSLAGVLGAASLGHYAAANQALDVLAHWRRERGLTALCVNWGSWQELHFATEMDKQEFARAGLHPMRNDRALAALGQLISNDRTSAVVASVDWDALRGVYEAGRARPLVSVDWDAVRGMRKARPLPSEIPCLTRSGDRGAPTQTKPVPAESDFTLELQSASPARRRDLLTAHLRALVADVLGFDASREIDLEQGLFELGMDSLVSVDLKGRLERTLGLQLPSTLTFNYPNIKALTDYILTEALRFDSETVAEITEPLQAVAKSPPVSQLADDLSEEEITNLLLRKLEQLQ